MRSTRIRLMIVLLLAALAPACQAPAPDPKTGDDTLLQDLLTRERSALDRWLRLDPDGYLAIYAPDITYFDQTTERRVTGRETLGQRFAPMKSMKAPFTDGRYEFVEPQVQHVGDLAVLTFNLLTFGKLPDGVERELARWNTTEVYRRDAATWTIVHSHWSFIQGQAKPAGDLPQKN